VTHPDPLQRAARAIADGTPVDWVALARTHPELRSRIEILSRLAGMARQSLEELPAGIGEAGTMQPTWIAPKPPFLWGSLEVREQIGAGSFGLVYRAFDTALEREVALKLRAVDSAETDLSELLDEARLLARARHLNVLAIHGVEVRDGMVGLWTELVRGQTLEERLAAQGPLPVEEVVRTGIDLARALAAVHDAGLIHGDVKTANAMVEEDGRTLLMDFGAGTRRHMTATLVHGTPLFMAPELLRGDPPSVAGDLYALGAVLYRLLTGRYPVDASDWDELLERQSRGERLPLEELRPGLPAPLVRGIERALAPDPANRPVTASEFELYLRAAFDSNAGSWTEELGGGRVPGLPQFATRFIGRRTELLAVRRLLVEPGLVTLIGAGGAGKTRLAVRAAQDLASGMPDGVTWVDLSGATSDDLVAILVARALGLPEQSSQTPLGILRERLAERTALIVLDNCEHRIAACAQLAGSLLSSAPRLRILATSRAPLRVEGERTYRIPSLSVPALHENSLRVLDSEAVRLFVDRITRGPSGFVLSPSSAPDVARIVRRVDGVPLAIELAAARASTLGVATVADRLEDGFRLLDGPRAGALTRHGTIRASIGWSYDLLPSAEAKLLDRLSVFVGGFPLEAAEAVCGDEGQDGEAGKAGEIGKAGEEVAEGEDDEKGEEGAAIEGRDLIDLLSALTDTSLVQFDPEPRPRYRLLEMVREFGGERLAISGEADRMRRRHLHWCRSLAGRHEQRLFGPDQESSLIALDDELDNFRTAAAWGSRQEDPHADDAQESLRLCTKLRRYWVSRGHRREGIELMTAAAAVVQTESDTLGLAAIGIGSALTELGDLAGAKRWVARGIEILRRLDSQALLASGLTCMALVHNQEGDYVRSRELLIEASSILRSLGRKVALATALGNLGVTEGRAGNLDAAEARYLESIELFREMGDEISAATIQMNLGYLAFQRGDLEKARRLLGESVKVQRRSANQSMIAISLAYGALVEIADRKPREAQALLIEGWAGLRRHEQVHSMVELLESSARLLASIGQPETAARLLAASMAARETVHVPVTESDRTGHEDFVQSLRATLGEARFVAATVEGRTIPRRELISTAESALLGIDFRD
jgi:non-specific serine/threonine protein kinase